MGAKYGSVAVRFEKILEGRVVFFLHGGTAFLQGFCDFHRFFGWFFVVRLWWFCGEVVVFGGRVLGAKNTPRF